MNFYKKIVLITGASRGIGKTIAKKLSQKGATVIGTATNHNSVKKINSNLEGLGYGIILNVNNYLSIKNLIKNIIKKFNNIDILINNAGIKNDKLLLNMKINNWKSVINTNLTSIYLISKEVIPYMIKKRYGRIINISSMIANTGNIGQTNYSASKAGLIGFSKSLALEVAKFGITVNIVAPGFIKTDMTKSIIKKYHKQILSQIPLNRFGYPSEVADAVIFYASDSASYITGNTLHINGGIYMP